MLTVGLGYLGVLWERASGCDARRFNRAGLEGVANPINIGWHVGVGAIGLYLLTRRTSG